MTRLPFSITVDKIKTGTTGNYKLERQENKTDHTLYFMISPECLDNISGPAIEVTFYLTLPSACTQEMNVLYTSPCIKHISPDAGKGNKGEYHSYVVAIDAGQWKKETLPLVITLSNFSLAETIAGKTIDIKQFDAFFEYKGALFQHRFEVTLTGEKCYHDLYKALTIRCKQPTYETGKGSFAYRQFSLQDVMTLYKNTDTFNNEFQLLIQAKDRNQLKLSENNTRLILSLTTENGTMIPLENHVKTADDWNAAAIDGHIVLSPKSGTVLSAGKEWTVSFKGLPVENMTSGKLKLEWKGFDGFNDKTDELEIKVEPLPEGEFTVFEPERFEDLIDFQQPLLLQYATANMNLAKGIGLYYQEENKQKEILISNVGKSMANRFEIELSKVIQDLESNHITLIAKATDYIGNIVMKKQVIGLRNFPSELIIINDNPTIDMDRNKSLLLKVNRRFVDLNSLYINGRRIERSEISDTGVNLDLQKYLYQDFSDSDQQLTLTLSISSFDFPPIRMPEVITKATILHVPKLEIISISMSSISNKASGFTTILNTEAKAKFVRAIYAEFKYVSSENNITLNRQLVNHIVNSDECIKVYDKLNIDHTPYRYHSSTITFYTLDDKTVIRKLRFPYCIQRPSNGSDDILMYLNEFITSGNAQYVLTLEQTGELVIVNLENDQVKWRSGTVCKNVTSANFQTDGNFVLYKDGKTSGADNAAWALNKDNHNGSSKVANDKLKHITQLILTDKGALEAKDIEGNIVWSSEKKLPLQL